MIEEYTDDNRKTKQIVRRFDEVLLEKASKFSIDQIYQTLSLYINNATFENFTDEYNKNHILVNRKIELVEQAFFKTKEDITNEMEKAVKRAFLKLK